MLQLGKLQLYGKNKSYDANTWTFYNQGSGVSYSSSVEWLYNGTHVILSKDRIYEISISRDWNVGSVFGIVLSYSTTYDTHYIISEVEYQTGRSHAQIHCVKHIYAGETIYLISKASGPGVTSEGLWIREIICAN